MREAMGDVLVIDDEPDVRTVVGTVLSRAGFSVIHAHDGTSGVSVARASNPSCIVLDVGLPDIDGWTVLAQVRAESNVPVLMLTARGQEADKVHGLQLGADDYVTKPFGNQELVARVTALIRRSGPTTRRHRVLAIGAHPDDVEIGVGGILAAHRASGDAVTILTLTSGAAGGDCDLRETESRASASLLGADVIFGRLPDTQLPRDGRLVEVIEQVVSDVRPDVVYTHGSADLHQDHAATHHATLVACRRVARVYGYQSPSSTVGFAPTRYITIDDQLAHKLETIACYRSQTELRDYLADDLLTATARYWGRYANGRFAEPLEVIAERDQLAQGQVSHVA